VTVAREVRREALPVDVNLLGTRPVHNQGRPVNVNVTFEVPPTIRRNTGTISFHMGARPRTTDLRQIGTSNVNFAASARAAARGGEPRRIRMRSRLRIPRGLRRRRQFLVACIGRRPRASRCVASRRPIYIRGVRRR
jgi:hypothetical protein